MIKTSGFIAHNYILKKSADSGSAVLLIEGEKSGRPNQRIRLNQKGLKISRAGIKQYQKDKQIEHQISRINYLPTLEEVRLHTAAPLYPGKYEIELEFSPVDVANLKALASTPLADADLRRYLPSIDNPQARKHAKLEVEL